jgi:VanZ family protein
MIIKLLLKHKIKLALAAVCYTAVLTYFCLVTPDKFSNIISQSDMVIHALAYFLFTISWFVAGFNLFKTESLKLYVYNFLWALSYGVLIEILQHYCTISRQGDFKDICANILGTVIALVVIKLFFNKFVKS